MTFFVTGLCLATTGLSLPPKAVLPADLPASVITAIDARIPSTYGRIGNPGAPWNDTADFSDHSLPTRRLIWAATAGGYFFVHYEQGGHAGRGELLAIVSPPDALGIRRLA